MCACVHVLVSECIYEYTWLCQYICVRACEYVYMYVRVSTCAAMVPIMGLVCSSGGSDDWNLMRESSVSGA